MIKAIIGVVYVALELGNLLWRHLLNNSRPHNLFSMLKHGGP